MSDTLVSVTGTYVDAAGDPCSGSVSFRPVVPAGNTDTVRIVYDLYVDAALDANGALSVDLVASDDADWALDSPLQYFVLENIQGRQQRGYTIQVEGPGPVDLAASQPVTSVTPHVTTVQGPPGPGVLALAVGADIPAGTTTGTVIVRY